MRGSGLAVCAFAITLSVLATLVSGCAASGAMRAAERGDLTRLKAEIAAREKAGSLSNGEAARIAKTVASRDITSAPKEQAVARVRDAQACAADLDDALAARMKARDAAGAEAAWVRADAAKLDAGDERKLAGDADEHWRAVGARGLTREEDRAARLRALVDPAPGVRRGAMRAAIEANDARDFDALVEAARLDPEPMVRTEAVRALARIGGAAVAGKLRDLWTNADDPVRADIAMAWSAPSVYAAGGRDELRLLLADGRGPAAIDGASARLRAPKRDAELDTSASALLARTIATGSLRDRLHAIAVVPRLEGDRLEALRAAAKGDDPAVRVGALARLTESTSDRASSIAALEAIAGAPAPGRDAALASRAKLALATAGDLRAQAWLEADLAAPDPETRLSAAAALGALGRSARGAPLLADPDPRVRIRAACTLLVGARSAR